MLPFTDTNLLSVLPRPVKPREECGVCRAMGRFAERFEKGGVVSGAIPHEVSSLRECLRLGENVATDWLESCRECGGLYYVHSEYEFLIGGSEDILSYRQVSPENVLELPEVAWARSSLEAQLREEPNGTWRIVREPSQSAPQRRAAN